MPPEDGTLMEGETGGIMDGAAEEAAELFAQIAGAGEGGQGSGSSEGQGPESPTGTGDQASGASEEGTPTSDKAGEGDQTGKAGEGEGEKPPPYDQDPKWKAARAAEAELNSILEEHGFTSADDLKEALSKPAADKLGDEDPEQLMREVQEYRQLRQQQEAERLRQQEEGETPEETIERLRQENDTLKRAEAERAETERAIAESRRALERYEKMATDIVDKLELGGKPERDLALQLLGVGNPLDDVELNDRKAVADALRTQVPAVKKAIDTIRQRAVDDYAAGKSHIVPGKKAREAAEAGGKPGQQPPAQRPGTEAPPKTDIVEDPTAEFQDIEKTLVQEILRESGEIAAQS